MRKIYNIRFLLAVCMLVCGVNAVNPPAKNRVKDPAKEPVRALAKEPSRDTAQPPLPQTLSLDVKETDISDVIRMISKGYGLNIILDREVTGKVTLHLTDVPVLEGLNTLAKSSGWELVKEGSVYRIRKPGEKESAVIRFSRDKLTVDVQNMDVLDFIKEVSSKTAVSIVADNNLNGKVNGKLYDVPLDDGLKAILQGSGFNVVRKRNIYSVSQGSGSGSPGGPPSYERMRMPQRAGGKNIVECSNGRLTIDVVDGSLADVINTISEQCEIQIVTYDKLAGEVDAKLHNVPLTEALALLLGGTRFTFVQRDSVILIGDRNSATPSGQTLSKSEMIHLKHIKADDVPQILPKNIPINNVKVIKEQNALLVSGTSEDIVQTIEFLETVDIPTPQVVIDVLVVEYTRNASKDFGWGFGWGGTKDEQGVLKKVNENGTFPDLQAITTGSSIKQFFSGNVNGMTFIQKLPDSFYAYLKLLESQNKAKVLAQPSITVLNGNKAKIDVGQTQYYAVKGGTDNNPTLDFRPINFGISLNITPWISKSGQITAEISPEISNSPGVNKNSNYPDISRRSVTTTVRINNGETLILGGLLKSEQTVSHIKVPILGDIPIIGFLFRQSLTRNSQTNLVIYITPHVVEQSSTIDLGSELKKFDINERKGDTQDDIFDRANTYSKEKEQIKEKSQKETLNAKKRLEDLRTREKRADSTKTQAPADIKTDLNQENNNPKGNAAPLQSDTLRNGPPNNNTILDTGSNRK